MPGWVNSKVSLTGSSALIFRKPDEKNKNVANRKYSLFINSTVSGKN
jgi:hypothetical protein